MAAHEQHPGEPRARRAMGVGEGVQAFGAETASVSTTRCVLTEAVSARRR
ncbi:hypothetical protein ACFYM5_26560 [Streptomyces sp. NPDC006706]